MPTFPFRRSPGQDLRDLFAHDRLQVQANDLGYSSLSPGEGAAEVLNAAGVAVAMFGHHAASGKAGLLVVTGSTVQTLQEYTAAAVVSGTGGLSTRVGNLEGRADDHASRIGATEGVNATQTTRLDSHASRLGASEGDIATLQSGKVSIATHNALAGRVGGAENEINALQSAVVALAQNMTAVFGRVNSHQQDLESLGKPYRPPLVKG